MFSFDVTIAGEINLDLVLYGLEKEIPVERELLATGFEVTLGSSSAILAHNLASLGMATGFITRVGRDELGQLALDRLAESGADVSKVVKATNETKTGVTILLAHGRERHILTYPGTMFEMTRADLDIEYLASARHFHLSSLFLLPALQADLPELFRELKSRGLTLSLDTNDDPEDKWNGVLPQLLPYIDLLLPNKDELCRMTRRSNLDEALAEISSVVPIVAVKRGSEGAVVQSGKDRIEVPGITVQPVDTIGAGDSFNAGFLAAWLSGCSLEESARAGNITGAFSTVQSGGTEAFRDHKKRDEFLRQHRFPAVQSRAAKRSSISNHPEAVRA
ncbi:carbohydrate kinase family protein [Paracidobacterium acidisoli]|uniref:Carbohydrate kinase family protein n=1 Tax=Paracidobacterium acidisoli TaxID=2303751 RepID=A0A372IUM1_9BACT|nr:carbohydrate kinase family protein [Paracidobacterium acidisoli]MBT9330108.1 carbohydrate kinase family protein [Paracidobacterium acidisoli]